MAEHTPGPWAFDRTVSTQNNLPCVVDEHRLIVAECLDDGHTEEECEANARLIAAAPELLEAGSALIEYAKQGKGVTADLLNNLQAAITRAGGI